MIFDPDNCLAIIAAYPDLRCTPQLVAWLNGIGVAQIVAHRLGGRLVTCAYNAGVLYALASEYEQFIFADADVWPGSETEPFLAAEYDAVGAEYDTGDEQAFKRPNEFHTALWRTRRRVLEAVGARPFEWRMNETGTATIDCPCNPFVRRIEAAGFAVGHAGHVLHIPRRQGGLPSTVILSH